MSHAPTTFMIDCVPQTLHIFLSVDYITNKLLPYLFCNTCKNASLFKYVNLHLNHSCILHLAYKSSLIQEFPDVYCWEMPHLIHVCVAAICLVIFVTAAAFCELLCTLNELKTKKLHLQFSIWRLDIFTRWALSFVLLPPQSAWFLSCLVKLLPYHVLVFQSSISQWPAVQPVQLNLKFMCLLTHVCSW